MTRAPKYRSRLPQLASGLFLSDGGLETTLIFHKGLELPCFAAFVLLDRDGGRQMLHEYFDRYVPMAMRAGTGFILESPTWRANPEWGARLDYSLEALERNNRAAIDFMLRIRDRYETQASPLVVSGCIGPRGDGYNPGVAMTDEEAAAYHGWQIRILREAGADMVSAITMTSSAEGLGVARAAKAAGMPCAISFTVETDGSLPSGESLRAAIETVDAATCGSPAYYMINCAHPDHFASILEDGEAWTERVRGLRANASRQSHAELDNSPDLDDGDPHELGNQYATLRRRFPRINVLGGCCGTDHRHLGCISEACCKPTLAAWS